MKKINNLLALLFIGSTLIFSTACSSDNDDNDDGEEGGIKVSGLKFDNLVEGRLELGEIGSTAEVKVSADPSNAVDLGRYYYTYTSSNRQIFTVSAEGVLTALAPGEATLTAIAKNNAAVTAQCKVKVWGTLITSIVINDEFKVQDVLANDVINLKKQITILPENASNKNLVYTSSDENVVKVDEFGKMTAVWEGTATIKAEAGDGGGIYDECTVNVSIIPATSITIEESFKIINLEHPYTVTLTVGTRPWDDIQIQPSTVSTKAVKFTSSDPTIATVDENGEISGVKSGTATITVETTDGSNLSDDCVVNVTKYNYASLDRASWVLTTTPTAKTEYGEAEPKLILDDETLETSVSFTKVGAEGGPEDNIYFIVDMGVAQEFNYFKWTHTPDAGSYSYYLRAADISIYGSNDGIDFSSVIQEDIDTHDRGAAVVVRKFDVAYNYRYIKVVITPMISSVYPDLGITCVLVKDFQIGTYVLE